MQAAAREACPDLISERKCPHPVPSVCPEGCDQASKSQETRYPERVYPPTTTLGEESHQGMGWGGAPGTCASHRDQRVLSQPPFCLRPPAPQHTHLPISISWPSGLGVGLALRSHSLTLPTLDRPVISLASSRSSLAPLGLCTGCHQKLPPGPSCALGQVTPSQASHPHWCFEKTPGATNGELVFRLLPLPGLLIVCPSSPPALPPEPS